MFTTLMWLDREGLLHAMQGANQAAAAAMLEHPTIFIGQVRADAQCCTDSRLLAAAAAGLAMTAVGAVLHYPGVDHP